MSAWDKINLAFSRQVSPNWIYFDDHFNAGEYRKILHYRVDQGFGYLLRFIDLVEHRQYILLPALFFLPSLRIEFYVNRCSRQNDPIPPNNLCADNSDATVYPFTGSTTLNVAPLASKKILNYFYPFGSTIELHLIRDPSVGDTVLMPGTAYFHYKLVLKGYNVPEPQSGIW